MSSFREGVRDFDGSNHRGAVASNADRIIDVAVFDGDQSPDQGECDGDVASRNTSCPSDDGEEAARADRRCKLRSELIVVAGDTNDEIERCRGGDPTEMNGLWSDSKEEIFDMSGKETSATFMRIQQGFFVVAVVVVGDVAKRFIKNFVDVLHSLKFDKKEAEPSGKDANKARPNQLKREHQRPKRLRNNPQGHPVKVEIVRNPSWFINELPNSEDPLCGEDDAPDGEGPAGRGQEDCVLFRNLGVGFWQGDVADVGDDCVDCH